MEDKVRLYDSSGVKIGETYARRAKQLVKQQRAIWIGEGNSALRFAPGMENLGVDDASIAVTNADEPETVNSDDSWLIDLAKRKLRAQKMFVCHSVLLIPVSILLFFMSYLAGGSYLTVFIMGLTMGSWVTAYVIHVYFFTRNRRGKSKLLKNERMERLLSAEVALLRSEFEK